MAKNIIYAGIAVLVCFRVADKIRRGFSFSAWYARLFGVRRLHPRTEGLGYTRFSVNALDSATYEQKLRQNKNSSIFY